MASVDLVLNEGVKQKSKVYDLGSKKEDLNSVHFCHGIKEREGYFFYGFSRRNFLTRQYKPTNQSVVKNYKQIQLSQCCVALAVSHTVIGT